MQSRQTAGAVLRKLWHVSRVTVPLGIGAFCVWVVFQSLTPGVFDGVGHAVHALKLWQWVGAFAATGVSFWALARYDLVLHRHFRTNIPARHASISGAAAIAIGQTIGMGVISGAFVRWRMLPDLSLGAATKISVAVAATFLLGLVLTAGVIGLLAPSEGLTIPLSLLAILTFFLSAVLTLKFAHLEAFGRTLRLPSVKALMTIGGLTVIDVVFAGLAFWLLLPAGAAVDLLVLMPAFVLALGAGIVTGAPGGVGPFELTLLVLLPEVPQQDLLVGIVSYRLVYYAVPTVLAAALLIRPFPAANLSDTRLQALKDEDHTDQTNAETGLLRQSGARVLRARNAAIGVLSPGQSLCALFNPLHGATEECLNVLQHVAHQRNDIALFYKATARDAVKARRLGWSVVHVADDVVVDVPGFTTDGPQRRQLRRKLRQASKAGVNIIPTEAPPWVEMGQLDQAWQKANGPARGVTMGRFCPRYLRHQRVFLAMQGSVLVGFSTFHHASNGLCLDVTRVAPDAPHGTMHLLMVAAIEFAKGEACQTLSLAALPPASGPLGWLASRCGADGLRQFKTSFAARRLPRYAAAPSSPELWLALVDLWLAIRRPKSNSSQVHHEDYEFDYIKSP